MLSLHFVFYVPAAAGNIFDIQFELAVHNHNTVYKNISHHLFNLNVFTLSFIIQFFFLVEGMEGIELWKYTLNSARLEKNFFPTKK